MKLEDIKPGAKAKGIIPNILADIISVEWIGEQAINVVFRDSNAKIAETTLYRDKTTFITSIIPARSVNSSFRGPTNYVVFVLLEYPAVSIARRMLPRDSLRSASRKAHCLSVSSLVAISILFLNNFDMNMKSIIAIIMWLIFLPLLYLYLPLIFIANGGAFDAKII